ncbi:MAG: Fic family protein [Thermoplasmata archaeon]|nr:Fic family protein [Thermoplasmata archaeon]
MAVETARFAHCIARRPVEYRAKSPFRPSISAPLDFAVRVGELYTLDHELDRAVLRDGDYAYLVGEELDAEPGPMRVLDAGAVETTGAPHAAGSTERSTRRNQLRRQSALNHARLEAESAGFRPPWTVDLLQDVHATLQQGLGNGIPSGELRRSSFSATDPEGEPVFHACPPDRIRGDLQAVLDWVDRYGALYHPLIPATVLFQALFSIRPFPSGSVSVGRSVALLYLRHHGLPNVAMAPVATVSLASPELAMRLLLWTEATGSYTELLDHHLDSVLQAYAIANRRWLGESVRSEQLEEVQLRLVARARRAPGWFSARDAMQWVGARSDQTILRHLNELVGRGILESLGRTRGKRFRVVARATAPPVPTSRYPSDRIDSDGTGTTESQPTARHRRSTPSLGSPP